MPIYLLLLCLLISLPVQAARYALVIGNANYPAKQEQVNDLGRLSNPLNDAQDMADLLQDFDFTLVDHENRNLPLVDASKAQMNDAVDNLMRRLRENPNSDVIFYYSGHGLYLKDVKRPHESANYLIPVGQNFIKEEPAKIKRRSVNAHEIKERLEDTSARTKLMIFDTCRDKLELKETKGFGGGGEFKPMSPINGLMVVHATLHNYKSLGSRRLRNSRFTTALLPALKQYAANPINEAIGQAILAIEQSNQQLSQDYQQFPSVEGTLYKKLCLGTCGVIQSKPQTPPPPPEPSYAKQLKVCAVHLAANRLTRGSSGNALACYQDVLSYDRNNLQALEGLGKLADRFVVLIDGKLSVGDVNTAKTYLKRLQNISPEHPEISRLQQALGAADFQVSQSSEAASTSANLEISPPRRSQNYRETAAGLNLDMIWIKGDCFTIGSPESEKNRDSDEAQKRVCVHQNDGYWMGKTEVTQAQWQAIMGDNPSHFKGANRPVEQVSWNDIQTFLNKLKQRTGKNYRLPTEAEWEYAARAGSNGAYGQGQRERITQNNLSRYAWFSSNSDSKTHPVGSKRANAYGLHDMHGNVWEWTCSAWSSTYNGEEQQCKKHAESRSLRGGSWNDGASYLRSAFRLNITPDTRLNNIGLRLAREK